MHFLIFCHNAEWEGKTEPVLAVSVVLYTGLLRNLIMSRFCKLLHRDFGKEESVTNPSDNGVKFSVGESSVNISEIC